MCPLPCCPEQEVMMPAVPEQTASLTLSGGLRRAESLNMSDLHVQMKTKRTLPRRCLTVHDGRLLMPGAKRARGAASSRVLSKPLRSIGSNPDFEGPRASSTNSILQGVSKAYASDYTCAALRCCTAWQMTSQAGMTPNVCSLRCARPSTGSHFLQRHDAT